MKKAIVDQLFLGFMLGMALFAFAATAIDETNTRNYIYDIKDIAKVSARTMAGHYVENYDPCTAQKIASDIVLQSQLGQKLANSGLISYQWLDLAPDTNGDGVGEDGEPDTVRVTIAQHPHKTFWYNFFGFDNFMVGPFTWDQPINTPRDVTITYGGEDAGFTNMVGTYDLVDGCVTNPQLILTNSDNDSLIGTQLGNPITSPPTYIFIISDGYNKFKNGSDYPRLSDTVLIQNNGNPHCTNDPDPTVTINGISKTQSIYFEQTNLNGDGYEHIQIIPKTIWNDYNTYINGGSGRTYSSFIALCNIVNYDNDATNNIPGTNMIRGVNDCKNDINNEYQYAMEDLYGGGDQDFNDIFLDTTRLVHPNDCNCYTINPDGTLNLNCTDNNPPTVDVSGCPLTIDENTTTSAIFWTDSDSDGTVVDRDVYATNGNAVLNPNGTITYTPNPNYSGEDTVTLRVRDNEGSSATDHCEITILNVNNPPDISGTAQPEVVAGNNYIFIPTATDPDGDPLTFTINNKPSWANFDTSTGQLSGAPSHDMIGVYSNIVIIVNDGNGGTDALTFSINVLEDSDNQAPVVTVPIPDQTVQEGNAFTYDVSLHFADPDGDPLTFSGSYIFNGHSYAIAPNTTGIISTMEIPNGYVGQTITITIIASDGVYSVSDVFNVSITDHEDLAVFDDTFDEDDEGWQSGNSNIQWIEDSYDSNNGKLRIFAKSTQSYYWGGKAYNYGPAYANRDVKITFDMDFRGGWESYPSGSYDTFFVVIDGDIVGQYTNIGNGSTQYINRSYEVIGRTDSLGVLSLVLGLKVSSTGEYMQVDNVHLELQ